MEPQLTIEQNKPFLLPIILSTSLSLLSLGFTGFLYYQTTLVQKQLNILTQQINTPQTQLEEKIVKELEEKPATNQPDSSTQHESYTYKNLFSVSFPSEFVVKQMQDNGFLLTNSLPADPDCKVGGCFLGTQKLNIYFDTFPAASDIETFAKDRRDNSLSIDPGTTALKPTTLNGLSAYSYSFVGEGYSENFVVKINSTIGLQISVNYPSQSEIGSYKPVAESILSTIKITSK